MSDAPWLERFGVGWVRRREGRLGPTSVQVDPHRLDAKEQAELRAIQRRLVVRAAIVGALSGLIAALTEIQLDASIPLPESPSTGELARYWGILGGVTVVASLAEVVYLYLASLHAVHAIARTAGIPLTQAALDPDPVEELPASPMTEALVRAALELPNPPPRERDIDPMREATRWRTVLAGLLYKAKIGLTSFLIKLILRRAIGRAVLRVWLVFVGVPVTAFWNGLVAWLVIREARLRAIGPSAARRFCELLDIDEIADDPMAVELAWRSVAACVVRTHELHPNVLALFEELESRLGQAAVDELDDSALFLRRLGEAETTHKILALRLLAVAAILDGRMTRDERRLVREAGECAGLPIDAGALAQLRRQFAQGRPLGLELFAGIAHRPRSA